tara:strand:+ start:372 stop:1211 length:840 start_codon:yes stop_codon:yes gene_type:complete
MAYLKKQKHFDGKVSIGTKSPTGDMTLESGTTNKPVIRIENTNADAIPPFIEIGKDSASPADDDEIGGIRFFGDDDAGNETTFADMYCYATDVSNGSEDGKLLIRTQKDGALQSFVINGGNLGVGTASPTGMLHIKQTSGSRHITTTSYSTASHNHHIFENNSGTNVGAITVTTSGTAFNTSSDYRIKENIVPMDNAITRLKALKPSRFNFIVDTDKTMDGFLAHEVSDIVPEAVSGEKDAVNDHGDIEPQGIDQSKLVPLLVGALQEAIARIEVLESE